MWQAFVPATGRDDHGQDGPGTAGKKRRRAVAAGEGEAVSALYASVVQPGETGIARRRGRHPVIKSWLLIVVWNTEKLPDNVVPVSKLFRPKADLVDRQLSGTSRPYRGRYHPVPSR